MTTTLPSGHPRIAIAADGPSLVSLWAMLFDEESPAVHQRWSTHAQRWFDHAVDDENSARFPVFEVEGDIVATAIGTLEIGVPNPHCPTGRGVRLANLITMPEHRGNGYGTSLVLDVIGWARSIAADRVDLSSTSAGQGLYERLGFAFTSAPRMKLVL